MQYYNSIAQADTAFANSLGGGTESVALTLATPVLIF